MSTRANLPVAIMIPMTDHHAKAHVTEILRPTGWSADAERVEWPETTHEGIPLLPSQIADEVQGHIGLAIARDYPGLVIVTRSEMAVLRARRMVAEGAALDVTIYIVTAAGQRAIAVEPDGGTMAWEEGLFSESFEEVKAIQRARRRREAAAAKDAS